MARWQEFEAQAAEIAALGRQRLFEFGPGLAYLATVRADGGPRVHPVCPNIVRGGLLLLIGPSPKRGDLHRDGRFALHSFPLPDRDDEFYLSGRAEHREDTGLDAEMLAAQKALGVSSSGDEHLFELLIERALYSRYKPRGAPDFWPPDYLKWKEEPDT